MITATATVRYLVRMTADIRCYESNVRSLAWRSPGTTGGANKRGGWLSGPEMGKLKWVTKSVSFSCQDPPPKFARGVSFPSAFRVTRFSLPVSGPLSGARVMQL